MSAFFVSNKGPAATFEYTCENLDGSVAREARHDERTGGGRGAMQKPLVWQSHFQETAKITQHFFRL